MDQFKKYLVVVRKYQFWIICAVMLLVAIVCWWMATSDLAGQFQTRKTALEGKFREVEVQPNHPNDAVISAIGKLNDDLGKNVYIAWKILYDEQKTKNPFPPGLSDGFRRGFDNLKPKEELDSVYREEYQNFIKTYLPTLQEKADVRRPAAQSGAAASKGNAVAGGAPDRKLPPAGVPAQPRTPEAPAAEEWIGTVDWNESDYHTLAFHFEWPETPSTLAVVLAQEDLWVYEALLRVIKNTNEGSAAAAVKQIEALQIGSEAAGAWKTAEESIFHGGQTGGPAPSAARPSAAGPGGTAATDEQDRQKLIESRYVGDKGQPLSYDPEYPYAKHPYAEFKMMPIHMRLVMDQRRLQKLLVECANSSMPIEVRCVRVLNRGDLSPAGKSSPRESGKSGGGAQGDSGAQAIGPFDVPVEILGLIYIYNPPDREKLGTGAAAAEEAAAPGAAPPEQPHR
jgi:hypothetical protein